MLRVDLSLVGFGNVARQFANLLEHTRAGLERDHGLDCRVVGVSTRRHGSAFDPAGLNLLDARTRVEAGKAITTGRETNCAGALDVIRRLGESRAPIRIMVETTTLSITDGRPAITHVEHAIEAACHVVTANKGPAAFAYRRLSDLAAAHGVSFLFEGVVMDGVPVFNLVRETMPAVEICGFRGVVNSTTNHILTALEDGDEFGPALERMQSEGVAEADASLDVEGWDAAAKAAALANVFLNANTTPHAVDRTGISASDGAAARDARARGNRLRLVASAARRIPGDGVDVVVRPVELSRDDLLAGLRGVQNALVLQTDILGDVAIAQLSGNLTMTAYALLSDLITIGRRCQGHGAGQP